MISITTLLGDTIAATLAALPRLPPLLLPSWLTIPPWLGCWLFSCCITRLVKDGGEQEMCGSEYSKCRVGEGDMEKQQCWLMSKLPVRLHLVTIEFGETDYVKLGLC